MWIISNVINKRRPLCQLLSQETHHRKKLRPMWIILRTNTTEGSKAGRPAGRRLRRSELYLFPCSVRKDQKNHRIPRRNNGQVEWREGSRRSRPRKALTRHRFNGGYGKDLMTSLNQIPDRQKGAILMCISAFLFRQCDTDKLIRIHHSNHGTGIFQKYRDPDIKLHIIKKIRGLTLR